MEKKTILVFRLGDRVGIRQRPAKGLLAGMWEFPSLEGHKTRDQILKWLRQQNMEGVAFRTLQRGKHIFSHVEWHMVGYEVFLPEEGAQNIVSGLVWCDQDELENQYAIPVAFHIFLHQIQSQ